MRQLWRKSMNSSEPAALVSGHAGAHCVWLALRFVHRTNPLMQETDEVYGQIDAQKPVIFAMWHGQHMLTPFAAPKGLPDGRDVFKERRCGAECARG